MSKKIEREIEELLARLDTFPPPKPWHQRLRESIADAFWAAVDRVRSIPLRLNPGYVVLIAIAAIVTAYFLYDDLGGFGAWIILAGIGVLIIAFVASLRRGSSRAPGGGTKYWRDRPIDLSRPGPDWKDRRHRR